MKQMPAPRNHVQRCHGGSNPKLFAANVPRGNSGSSVGTMGVSIAIVAIVSNGTRSPTVLAVPPAVLNAA